MRTASRAALVNRATRVKHEVLEKFFLHDPDAAYPPAFPILHPFHCPTSPHELHEPPVPKVPRSPGTKVSSGPGGQVDLRTMSQVDQRPVGDM